ncbi:MAG TPA: alpha/beta hydrolase, partial [Sandaracinaceae bacterium]
MRQRIDVRANGLRFSVLEEGEGERLALCLHGFPELGHSWRHQLPLLARLGYRAWAPDLRGYGRSDRPRGTKAYAIETLMDDVEGLIEAAGAERATILAHDWGGVIAWWLAMRRPARVERLVCFNIAHPMPLARELKRFRQLARFWYVAAFQIPGLGERWLSEDGYRRIDNAFLSTSVRPDRFTEEDLRVYREAAAQPGALTAMLSYYRAYVLGGGLRRQLALGCPVIEAPTLLIWGEHDVAQDKATT